MKKEQPEKASTIRRRDFMKISAGGAGAMMTMGAMVTALAADTAAQV